LLQISCPYECKYTQEPAKLGSTPIRFRNQPTETGRRLWSGTEETPPRMHISRTWGSERSGEDSRSEGHPCSETQHRKEVPISICSERELDLARAIWLGFPTTFSKLFLSAGFPAGNEKPGLVPDEVYKYPMGPLLP
jgi:hypothetical protein